MKKLTVRLLVFAGSFMLGMLIANVTKASSLENGDMGVLWKIEGKGIKTSYLFGTVHLIGKSDFDLSDKAKELLKSCDKLALELDMDDPAMQLTMMQHAGMKDGQSLKSLLSKEEYELVDKKVTELVGTGLAVFDNMKPFVVATMLYPSLFEEEIASYELTLIQLASEQQKEIIGLETVEEQLSIFDRIPYEVQAEELVDVVTDRDRMAKLFDEMVECYKRGDVNALQQSVEGYYEDAEYSSWLLDDRNKNWVPKVKEFSTDHSIFYAVGAGHLGGDNGVIHLLREAGYKVTKVE